MSEETMVPHDVSDIDMAFGGIKGLMPKIDLNAYRGTWGPRLFNEWFYCGLKKLDLEPKDGIDKSKALRHIKTIMGSFEPKHEHKEAACAYLFELWFKPTSTWEAKPFRTGT